MDVDLNSFASGEFSGVLHSNRDVDRLVRGNTGGAKFRGRVLEGRVTVGGSG